MADRRQYEGSHRWIKFDHQDDLNRADPRFWLLLGEAKSKCDHIAQVPLDRETAEHLHSVYFAKGIMATTAIEGNTLTEEQVRERMRGGLKLPPSKEYLGIEIDNMLAAYNLIFERVQHGEKLQFDVATLCELNKQILAGLELAEGVVPGELRHHSVAVGSYLAAPAEDLHHLIDRLCSWLDEWRPPDEATRVPFAFIKAVMAHIYIEWIHPFADGNGRLGRLAEFLLLISSGVPAPAAHVLTSHYNDTRTEYYRQLSIASHNGGDLRSFLMYAAQGFVDGLADQINRLHEQQERLMWQALVDQEFAGKTTPAVHRQRELALALGKTRGWTNRGDVRSLSATLMEAYYGKTAKTVTRDLNRLKALGFIRSSPNRQQVRANLELVEGMRPFVATTDDT
ncbi:MAG: Fic family protein [Acidimicrobiales bacterium]